jgi:hypothetical protein
VFISNYLGTGSENQAEVPNLFEALAISEIWEPCDLAITPI